jgi:hypothetical protein
MNYNSFLYFKVLHPRHKLQYFENAGWTEEWIKTARTIVCDEYKRSYEGLAVNNLEADESERRKVG